MNAPQIVKQTRGRSQHTSSGAPSDERWIQILDVSTELFRTKGFAGTSMRDISEAVGLLKGSLYYYIEAKEDLLFNILKGLHDDGETIIEEVQFGSDDPISELRNYVTKAVIFAGRNAKRLAIFLRDFQCVPADKRSQIISEREMYVRTAEKLIEEAQQAGLSPESRDVHTAAILLMGAVSSTHEWLQPEGPRDIAQVAAEVADQLINGIAS